MIAMKTSRVLLVDDHQLLRNGVKSYLETFPEIEVVGEAANGRDSLEFLKHESVDVVVLDLNMGEMDGISCAREIVKKYPNTSVLMLTMTDEIQYVRESIKVGAKGYLLKSCAKGDLGQAILNISAGGMYYSPELQSIVDSYNKADNPATSHSINEFPLTNREKNVLKLIIRDYSNMEIGEKLNISQRIVEVHKRNLIEKTGSKNIAGLIIFAARNNYLNDL